MVPFLRALLRLVARAERHPRALAALAAALLVLPVVFAARGCVGGDLRLSTFNIRRFGVEPTDTARLLTLLESLDADVIAVQEIQRLDRLQELAAELRRRGRPYEAAASDCGGRQQMHVGFLFDTRRVRLERLREFRELLPDEGEGGCTDGDRPGLLGVFRRTGPGGGQLHALVVHLKAGDSDEFFKKRSEQWQKLQAITSSLQAQGARQIILLGDVNSTGFLENRRGERDLIQGFAQRNGMTVASAPLGCTEYYSAGKGTMLPSLLDHVLISSPSLVPGSIQVHSHCAELRCEPQPSGSMPPSYTDVSDHCPVTFQVGRLTLSRSPGATAGPPCGRCRRPRRCR